MGSIHLTLNLNRIDLVIAISVVVIALIAVIGLIAWFVKSSRRNRMLSRIDSKLSPQQCEYLNKLAAQAETERRNAERVRREYEKATAETNNTNNITEAPFAAVTSTVSTSNKTKNTESASNDDEDYEGPDVMEEIRKMMMESEKQSDVKINRQPNNMGKSGKIYSREEIESLIED